MSRTGERRKSQRLALIDAAERTINQDGVGALKARDLADEIGVAVGSLYNLAKDLDTIVLEVASRTLARLDAEIAAVGEATSSLPPADRLVVIAIAYRRFASANRPAWRSLFVRRADAESGLPEWAVAERSQLFRHVFDPLAVLIPGASEDACRELAVTLFSAIHGIVWLSLEGDLVRVPETTVDRQIEILVRAVASGLTGRQA